MSRKKQTSEVRRKYEFIKSKQGEYNVRMMCRLMDVAASGYYAWLKTPVSKHAREDARLLRLIQASFKDSQCVYGAPRVFLDFDVSQPNKVWVTDITYIRTWEGWLYVAVVLDLFSRKVIGWAARPTIHRELVLDAVLIAVRRRKPEKTIIHSDQGSQCSGDDWRRFCKKTI